MVVLGHSVALLLLSSLVAARLQHVPAYHPHRLAHRHHQDRALGTTGREAQHSKVKRSKCAAKVANAHTGVVAGLVAGVQNATTAAVDNGADSTASSWKSEATSNSGGNSKSSTSTGPTTFTSTSHTSGGSWWRATSGNNQKLVVAHFIVGNAYSYTSSQWQSEIKLALAQGIDAFALNVGLDSWQPDRIQAAYDTASKNDFKMFFSFDMTVIPCSDGSFISNNIAKFASHPAQLKDTSGAVLVTTFDGGNCMSNGQWESILGAAGVKIRFAPAFFNDLTNTKMKDLYPAIGGDVLWGGAWPKGDSPIDWSEDSYRTSRNGLNRAAGDLYITTVSPWFSAHFPGKNYIWHVEDYLYAKRWEQLVQNRNQVDIVEIVSWNDYGESTYIGPIGNDMPSEAEAWVQGFPHQAWLEMTGYYTSAFKTGSWPSITADKVFVWGRPHGKDDNASSDGVGKPQRFDWAEDNLQVVLFATSAGSLTVSQGSSSTTVSVKSGVNKVSIPFSPANGVSVILSRGGNQIFAFSPAIRFEHNPKTYNFNANVAAGP